MLMLIMGLYSQYISKITSNFTSLYTSLQPKRTMHFKRFIRFKLIKRYIILNKEVFFTLGNIQRLIQLLIIITWRFIKIQTIITKESYGTKA
jgi:hypothetical protein